MNGSRFAISRGCRFFDPANSERKGTPMKRVSIVLLMTAALVATSGCATKKFVRNTVNASSDALSARIDTTEGEIKEVRDDVDKKFSTVNSNIASLDTKTTENANNIN